MSRRDPYWKRLQSLLNSEALKTPDEIRSTTETMETYAPGGRADKLMRLRESLDSEEQATPAALQKRFERLKEKLGRLAREQGLID